MLPGPPREMLPMLKEEVIPFLKTQTKSKIHTATVIIRNLAESKVEERCQQYINNLNIQIAYCASFESVKIYLSSENETLIKSLKKQLKTEFKQNVLPEDIKSVYEYLIFKLITCKKTLSTAESCTGGLIASNLTAIPGSSECFKGTVVSYSNEWKSSILKVPENILNNFGAVSFECIEYMLKVKDLYKTDASIAVTGIAGPGGGNDLKPVGTVFVAVGLNNQTVIKKFNFTGNREAIRQKAALNGINMLLNLLEKGNTNGKD